MILFRSTNKLKLKKMFFLIGWISLAPLCAFADSEVFPHYPSIEKNISFWQDVYARYSTTQGILHDDEDLSLIYDVIPLEPKSTQAFREINKDRIDRAKKKYREILTILSTSPETLTPELNRIAALFGPDADAKTFKKAAKKIRCQIGQKDRFFEGLKRSGAYLEHIQKIFTAYNIPTDLAYLPHVESSFDIKAYSKFGAAGIWQFTLGTGRRFLQIDYTLDERRDPIASSHAAALLLKENYEKLKSWPLAITAYNHGAAGMEKAKTQWADYPSIFKNYHSRSFKFASRNFYSEFLAARNIARACEQFFGEVRFDPPHRTHSVVLEGYAALEDILTAFSVDLEVVAELNPAIRPPVFKGQKYLPRGYRLHLPLVVNGGENGFTAGFPRQQYHQEQKPSHFYAVQKGDTAGKIARMHKVALSDLLLANNLDRNATIYVNQNLRIPLIGEHPIKASPPISYSKIEPLEIPKVPQPMLAAILPIPFGEPAPPSNNRDSIEALVARPISEASINPDVISGNIRIEKVWTEKEHILGLIKVEVEETLGHFADWLDIDTQSLRRLNGLRYGRYVHIGQALRIPLNRVSKELFEERRFDYHKRLQEDFFNAFQIEDLQPYYVRKGENIWTLSNEKFNLPIWLIQQCNPAVNFHNLRNSQKLMIPIVEKGTDTLSGL